MCVGVALWSCARPRSPLVSCISMCSCCRRGAIVLLFVCVAVVVAVAIAVAAVAVGPLPLCIRASESLARLVVLALLAAAVVRERRSGDASTRHPLGPARCASTHLRCAEEQAHQRCAERRGASASEPAPRCWELGFLRRLPPAAPSCMVRTQSSGCLSTPCSTSAPRQTRACTNRTKRRRGGSARSRRRFRRRKAPSRGGSWRRAALCRGAARRPSQSPRAASPQRAARPRSLGRL